MGELLVPVVLIVWMVGRFVDEGFAMQSLEARDDKPNLGIVEEGVAEHLKQFFLEHVLVMLGL